MPTNVLQNLIDSGLQFTEMQRKQADKVVRGLVKSGEIRRAEAAKTVESLIERGRETTEAIGEAFAPKSASSSVAWRAGSTMSRISSKAWSVASPAAVEARRPPRR